MLKLLVMLLVSTIVFAQAEKKNPPEIDLVIEIHKKNLKKLADVVKNTEERGEIYKGASDDEILSSRNCEPASQAFYEILKKDPRTAKLPFKTVMTDKHFYLSLKIKSKTYIIDPTYRQFYFVYLNNIEMEKGNGDGYQYNAKDYKCPMLLITEKSMLRNSLESICTGLKPEWQVKIGGGYGGLGGFYPSKYEHWYK